MSSKAVFRVSYLSIKQLFLIDAIGALVSASMLGLVLPRLQEYIGLPVYILRFLAIPAFIFFLYSIGCYFISREKKGIFLQVIAMGNFFYALITLTLLLYHFDQIRWLGWFYFTGELLIVLGLSRLEWKTARRGEPNPVNFS